MASRKITRSAKKTPATKSKAATKVAATKRPSAKEAAAAERPGKVPAPTPAPKPAPSRKASEHPPSTPAADYLPSGLEALLRRLRLRDQAAAKKLEPGISHLAKAYGKLLDKG